MNEEIRKFIGQRLKEERERQGWSQGKLADVAFVSKRSVASWESGESSPGSDALAVMSRSGVDVLYVVTGTREAVSPTALTPDEAALLGLYKKADTEGRGALHAVAALAGRSIAGGSKGVAKVTVGGDVGQQVNGDQTVSGPMTFKVGGKRK